MKRLFKSRFVRDYGSVFVLLLLCLYYSYATVAEQHPQTSDAGRKLARSIAGEVAASDVVLIVARDTENDKAFSDAIAANLKADSVNVETVLGSPIDVRRKLVELGKEKKNVAFVATHHASAQWGPLKEPSLKKMAGAHSSLANVKVVHPPSYRWPTFLTWSNIRNVVNQNSDVAIIAIGMTLVIITAGIDLSVGSLLAVSAVLTAIFIESSGGEQAGALVLIGCSLLGVLICGGCGALNGIMVTWFRVPAFVVTLATMMIARGLALIFAVRFQKILSGGTTEGTPEAIKVHAESFGWLGNGELFSVPNPIWLMIGLYIIAHLVMNHTPFGRYVYAVGGNAEAARLSGVPVMGVLIAVYVICGVMAGLGGIVDASRFEGGRPNAGELYELQVIAAVVVGGTSLSGGEGRIFGTLIGAMIIAVIQNGLNMAGVKSYEQKVVFGLLILAAVVLDQMKKKLA